MISVGEGSGADTMNLGTDTDFVSFGQQRGVWGLG